MDIITVNQAGELLLSAIVAIAAGGLFNAPLNLFIVSVLKRFVPESLISAGTLQLGGGIVLTVLFWIATHFGQVDLFNNVSNFIIVVGPALLNLLSGMAGSSALYSTAVKSNTGFVSYKRS